jgi:hypothetical protein
MAQPDRIDGLEGNRPVQPLRQEEDRPDWLVGADEGAAAEQDRHDEGGAAQPEFRLVRPDSEIEETGSAEGRHKKLPAHLANRPTAGEEPPKPKAWVAAASSVPRLELAPTASSKRAPEPDLDPQEEAFPGPPSTDLAEAAARPLGPTPSARVRPHEEPFWIVWAERIATDRKLLLLLGGVVAAAVAAAIFWPRGSEPGVSIGEIKRHPETYRDHTVKIAGRVGEVFAVGGAYAFNLHQGRDTVVVYTRLRTPVTHDRVRVIGDVSTGYLDGVARIAVFETQLSE